MKPASKNILFGFLFLISVSTLLPVLGLTHFYSDEEAQEAITTVNVLKSDHPFIPLENRDRATVTPPMSYWANILMVKILHQGTVNEYTLRLSSAIAAIIIALAMFRFYSRRNDNYNTAFFSAIIFLSAFEVHRSAITVQSDMVFTAFVTLALFQLYRWYEKRAKGIPLWAILFISAAALTKGIAGILLPCLIIGLFFGLRRESFFRIGYKIVATALASCLLPALWCYMACKEMGIGFLDQITTAFFYAPLNHISFPSSLYFLYSIIIGFLPWTLLILFSLFALIHKRRINPDKGRKIFSDKLFTENPSRLFFLSATGIILLFYLLFEESTSTRIIPIYPFLSIFLAEYMHHLIEERRKTWRAFGIVLSAISGLFFCLFIGVKAGWLDGWIPAHLTRYLVDFKSWNLWDVICLVFLLIFLYKVYKSHDIQSISNRYPYSIILLFWGVQLTVDTALLPDILNRNPDYLIFLKKKNKII